MPDIVDAAQVIEQEHLDRSIAAARVAIPAGVPGECETCGRDSQRLVDGHCAPCRDRAARTGRQAGRGGWA